MITHVSDRSPDKAFANGMGLGDIVRQFVIGDPEVATLIDRAGMCDRFEGGQCPLGLSDYHWPVNVEASRFEFRLTVPVGILTFGEPVQRPTREVSALSVALADRLDTVREHLSSERAQAWGLTEQFQEQQIPPRLWTRNNLSIDVLNNDLCEEDDQGRRRTLWRSVEIRSALNRVGVSDDSRQEGSKKRTPKGREVEQIIRQHKIDADELGVKIAAAAVAMHMKDPPKLAQAMKALEKQVARISNEVNRRG